jgi:hypothetical protein
MSLHELANRYGSLKVWHGYMPFYSKLFDPIKDSVTSFLEIGIDKGQSLFAWNEYFTNSTLYAIDILVPESVKYMPRVKWAVADQSKEDELKSTMNTWGNPTFDVIIEDGGHTVIQQRVSLETLWSSVRPGGWYIIEDLHTNIRALYSTHPHITKDDDWIDETPTMHDRILNVMAGSKTEFSFPVSEIEEIQYLCIPGTQSLTCALKKAKTA